METNRPALVWFRLDLRMADNPALEAAAASGQPLVPLFIWAPGEEGSAAPGAASRWWLHQSLARLDERLRQKGLRLIIRKGPALRALRDLVRETGASSIFWNRRYEPAVVARDTAVKGALQGDGLEVQSRNSALLFEPWTMRTTSGGPFQVFSPFWKACRASTPPPAPKPAPRRLMAPRRWPRSLVLEELQLEPRVDWAAGIRSAWEPGEEGAKRRLRRFVAKALSDYAEGRNRPDLMSTSRLSPHLHFGEIGPRQVWQAVAKSDADGCEAYLRELGWREFAHHVLFHFPHTDSQPLRSEFATFPWRKDRSSLKAWRRGRTGYPIVDAGMRELWATGWMHNRVRMIVASFLVKHLLIPWQSGAHWFWDTLVDADLANNSLGWQWTAGCGADAAPYFRVFNPIIQGQRFDPDGAYVRRWVPELAGVQPRWIHRPWDAPASNRPADYPPPIVEHEVARRRALVTFETSKGDGRRRIPKGLARRKK